jgi:hypothetical protein
MAEIWSTSNQIVIAKELTTVSLRGVIDGTIDVIVLEKYWNAAKCEDASRTLLDLTAAAASNRGTVVQMAITADVSIGQAGESEEKKALYFAQGQHAVGAARGAFGGVTPLDRLVYERLLVSWPSGVRLLFGENGAPGQEFHCRVWREGADTPVHIDSSRSHRILGPLGVTARVAWNCYVHVGPGGNLRYWRRAPGEREYRLLEQKPPLFGVSREVVGDPNVEIRPGQGDVLLFNAGRFHAVSTVETKRVSIARFLGYQGDDAPLVLHA